MNQMNNLKLSLCLFDGAAGAAAPGAGEGTTASTGVGTPEQQADKILYGKQAQEVQEGTEAPEGEEGVATPEKVTLKDLISTHPDVKTELERMIQARVKNSKAEVEQAAKQIQSLDPIVTALYARYSVADGDLEGLTQAINADNSYLEEEAEAKGMTVEQLAYVKRLEMINMINQRQQRITQEQMIKQQLQNKWDAESKEVKALYPEFDFATEIQSNEAFQKLIRSNFPVKDAYEFAHKEELEQAKQAAVASQMQKQVVSNIQARQERPKEAGLKGQQGFQVRNDPSKLTSKDIKEIRKRVEAGERISF